MNEQYENTKRHLPFLFMSSYEKRLLQYLQTTYPPGPYPIDQECLDAFTNIVHGVISSCYVDSGTTEEKLREMEVDLQHINTPTFSFIRSYSIQDHVKIYTDWKAIQPTIPMIERCYEDAKDTKRITRIRVKPADGKNIKIFGEHAPHVGLFNVADDLDEKERMLARTLCNNFLKGQFTGKAQRINSIYISKQGVSIHYPDGHVSIYPLENMFRHPILHL